MATTEVKTIDDKPDPATVTPQHGDWIKVVYKTETQGIGVVHHGDVYYAHGGCDELDDLLGEYGDYTIRVLTKVEIRYE